MQEVQSAIQSILLTFLIVKDATYGFLLSKITAITYLCIKRNNLENEFSSMDVAVSAWEHRKMKLQLRNDSISTYLHAIKIYPHGGLPTQYVLLVPCAVSSCSLNFVQIEYNDFSLYTSVYVFLSALLDLHVLSSLINFTTVLSVNRQFSTNNRTILGENIHVLFNILLRDASCCLHFLLEMMFAFF